MTVLVNPTALSDHKARDFRMLIDGRWEVGASDPIGFSPDGKGMVYNVRQRGVDNLWLQPLDGSAFRQLTHFTTERIARFKFSFDGSQIAIERGHNESDAVLLRDSAK